ESTCGSLLRELQHIWDEIGEDDTERDRMLMQLEQECLEVYRRKVDQASHVRAKLRQALADSEAELQTLHSALGEHPTFTRVSPSKASGTLREQVKGVAPQLEELRVKKDERLKHFNEISSQIQKISGEIVGSATSQLANGDIKAEFEDLSQRRLEEYQAQLHALQKEKSNRLHKVLEYVNSVHDLCAELGLEFFKIITEVHPSLDDSHSVQSRSITNETLDRLANTIQSLEEEKKRRIKKLQELGTKLVDLWNLMETPKEEQQLFRHLTCNVASSECVPGSLAFDIIEEAEVEVERLERLKASKMKELVMRKRLELEEICRQTHMEPDNSTSQDKTNALIDSGMVDPSELLSRIEEQIAYAKEDAVSRRDILDKIERWMGACEEESWLDDYNKDQNRYAGGRGAHLNLKRAERARVTVTKLPALVESLIARTRSWEEERSQLFMYDGVRLLAMLEEYNLLRHERDEEKRRMRDQKKLQDQLLTEQESIFGSKPSSTPRSSSIKKAQPRSNGMMSRRLSLGGALLQPVSPETPRTNGHRLSTPGGNNRRDSRPLATVPLNFVAVSKDDSHS
ncbi:hypothetical protein SELMODRAFT_21497, partial [Selaginella moellendorffii]